ncbi:hypothetical protein H4219_001655 [Mycoemilia scoparia]|uniref:Metaxin n=1 Tax=Mycoemilia scoparia TaxID=417184 RepID=A0A9W8DRM8_9FUNG|nr:hypothetical protein H4219_001655 [Mycoemilia scoparia]
MTAKHYVKTYLRLCNTNFGIRITGDPGVSATGSLPLLRDNNDLAESGYDHAIQYLERQGHNLDRSLSKIQKAEALAYSTMVREGFSDLLDYEWFLVEENFIHNIRPGLAKLVRFPASYIVPSHFKQRATKRISYCEWSNTITKQQAPKSNGNPGTFTNLESTKLISEARKYLDALRDKLGSQEFFFGTSPTGFDCICYGYLSLGLYSELKHAILAPLIKDEYPTIYEFCERMSEILQHGEDVSQPQYIVSAEPNSLATFASSIYQGLCHSAVSLKNTITSSGVFSKSTSSNRSGSEGLNTEKKENRVAKIQYVVGVLSTFLGYVIVNGVIAAPGMSSNQTQEGYDFIPTYSDEAPVVGGAGDSENEDDQKDGSGQPKEDEEFKSVGDDEEDVDEDVDEMAVHEAEDDFDDD